MCQRLSVASQCWEFITRPLALEPALWSRRWRVNPISWALIVTILIFIYPLKAISSDVALPQ
jgi:hypothetical protein